MLSRCRSIENKRRRFERARQRFASRKDMPLSTEHERLVRVNDHESAFSMPSQISR